MTFKKSFAAAGVATAVAIAGTGVAAAQDDADQTEGSAALGSIQGSVSDGALDPQGSVQADGFFNQIWEDGETGVISLAGVAAVIAGTAVVAGNVKGIADAYQAVIGASDAFQGVVADTRGFLQSQGIL
ncbi:MAG TPA: hypothetical protein H9870_04000 [Candidatus Corynebacterium avicola]|uniref:Secreted protein n=1 Tax=Candidatus Corynebacterium avicola TaxID=2838527 RepID=A0A9D1RNH4_9CORY|nr:hypothetical protein [Candidatus Corynebacterium avicola]